MGKTYRRFDGDWQDGDWQDDHVYAEIRANDYLRYSWNRRHMPDDERKDLIKGLCGIHRLVQRLASWKV